MGSDSALAAQWRQRYETVAGDAERLREENRLLRAARRGAAGPDLAAKYDDLKREYKLYRENARKALKESDAAGTAAPRALDALGDRGDRRRPPPRGAHPEGDKFAYLKNLMTKYLGTADPDAKEHMERAVMMVLGYTDDEKARILADRDASGSGLAPAGLAAWWG